MKIGIVSDTHGNVANTLHAITRLGEHDLAAVLHCGDIGTPDIIPLFAEWPTSFVFGNCDTERTSLRLGISQAGQTCLEEFGELELNGRRIALLHGHQAQRFSDCVESGCYDLVCYGHTHQPEQHFQGKTLVLNPGALHRANPHTFAIVDLKSLTAAHFPLRQTG